MKTRCSIAVSAFAAARADARPHRSSASINEGALNDIPAADVLVWPLWAWLRWEGI